MGVADKIKEIEEEMNRTQKNKATEHHLGKLKAQLAKLRRELLEDSSKTGPAGEGFAVQKFGNARVSLVGFPSVGKSSMLSKLTDTQSRVDAAEFTTLTCVPGVLYYNNCKLQLLDLPGIIDGAAHGKGNGRQVLAVAKASDLLLIVLEPNHGIEQRRSILRELDAMGIRINRKPPDVTFRHTKVGGVKLTSTCKLTKIDEQTCRVILHEYKVHNCELILREDITADDFIDVIEGNRKFIDALFVYNKIDTISMEDVDELARRPNSIVVSVNMGLGLDYLLEKIWEKLELVRVYTKRKGDHPDFDDPIILTKGRKGCDIKAICNTIHKDFINEFKYALVWGRSAKFSPQNCGLNHELMDEDVIQIFASHKQRQEKMETGKIKSLANNINAKNKNKGKGEKTKKKK